MQKNAQELKMNSLFNSPKKKLIFFSVIFTVSIIIITFQISIMIDNSSIRDVGMIIGIIGGIVPYALKQHKIEKKRSEIDDLMPLFLLTVVSSVKSGAAALRAIEDSADRNFGELSVQLKNFRANLSWGMPMGEAFINLRNKLGTKMSKRVITMLQISVEMGGDVGTNIEVIQKHVSEMQNIEKERKSALQPYIFVIYISFLVFIVVALLVSQNFFTEIAVVQNQLRESSENSKVPLGMFSTLLGMDVEAITNIIFDMALIEAIFGGLAAGKIGENSFIAGIKHVVIMVLVAIVAFVII